MEVNSGQSALLRALMLPMTCCVLITMGIHIVQANVSVLQRWVTLAWAIWQERLAHAACYVLPIGHNDTCCTD